MWKTHRKKSLSSFIYLLIFNFTKQDLSDKTAVDVLKCEFGAKFTTARSCRCSCPRRRSTVNQFMRVSLSVSLLDTTRTTDNSQTIPVVDLRSLVNIMENTFPFLISCIRVRLSHPALRPSCFHHCLHDFRFLFGDESFGTTRKKDLCVDCSDTEPYRFHFIPLKVSPSDNDVSPSSSHTIFCFSLKPS